MKHVLYGFLLLVKNKTKLLSLKYFEYLRIIAEFETLLKSLDKRKFNNLEYKVVHSFLVDMTNRGTFEQRIKFRQQICFLFKQNFYEAIHKLHNQASSTSKTSKKKQEDEYLLIFYFAVGVLLIGLGDFTKSSVLIFNVISNILLIGGGILFGGSILFVITKPFTQWHLDRQILYLKAFGGIAFLISTLLIIMFSSFIPFIILLVVLLLCVAINDDIHKMV